MAHDPITASVLELLQSADPDVANLVAAEGQRQATTVELIASENHVSPAVMHAMGTCLTNKYAEGYPGARYYGGCEHHDDVERLAQERAKTTLQLRLRQRAATLGRAGQRRRRSSRCSRPGDTFASRSCSQTADTCRHGLKVNMSGKWFNPDPLPAAL